MKIKALAVSKLNYVERERCLQVASTVTAPNQAFSPDSSGEWGMKTLSPDGRVSVLTYRGVEVRLFYKRQIVDVMVCDDHPDARVPIDEWLIVNLLAVDEKQMSTLKELAKLKRTIVQQQRQIDEERAQYLEAQTVLADTLNAARREIEHYREKEKQNAKKKRR